MAGKIIADQIEHSTAGSLDTSYVVNGSAKAWFNLNGSGTIAARDSFNHSGFIDNGSGNYSATFTNSMSNANYSVGTTGGYQESSAAFSNVTFNHFSNSLPTSSEFGLLTDSGISWGPSDLDIILANTSGDLA
jgi:hypothetical protein